MTESTTLQPATAARTSRLLGSFEIGARLENPRLTTETVANFHVTGAAGTTFAGVRGFASYSLLPSAELEVVRGAERTLALVSSLSGSTLVPVLETGIAGQIAYVVEAEVAGERLSVRLEREGRMRPRAAASVLADIAEALDRAHAVGLYHGAISPFCIWSGEQGRSRLGGFALSGKNATDDIGQLGRLALDLLAGSEWKQSQSNSVSVDRIRDHAPGLTEAVAIVIQRALGASTMKPFHSAREFAAAFTESLERAAMDLTAGAWEAISRQDLAMAELLVDMVVGYDPGSKDLPLLRHKLGHAGLSDPTAAATQLIESILAGSAFSKNGHADEDQIGDATGAQADLPELSPEMRQLLIGPPGQQKPRSNTNYWAFFTAGAFVMVLFMVAIAALMFMSN